MIKRTLKLMVLFLMAFFFASCAKYPSAPLNMAKLSFFDRMVSSVIIMPGCTGFVLKNDGKNSVILTAAHCVDQYKIEAPDGSVLELPVMIGTTISGKLTLCPGTVKVSDEERDLAVVVVEKCTLPTGVTALSKKDPRLGDTVYAVGHPIGEKYVLTKGIVSRAEAIVDDQTYTMISSPIIFGNSGGPCFNRNGEVIGVVVQVAAARAIPAAPGQPPYYYAVPHLGYAVPLKDIKIFLKKTDFLN